MLEKLAERIASESGLPREEIFQRIDAKRIELSDLVSEEGAAYIVAKELGVDLAQRHETLRLENVTPGMQNVELLAKVARIFPPKAFTTEHGEGRVQNVYLGDESGSLRMSLWNDEVERFALQEGDVVRVRGYVKEDNKGGAELRLGRSGSIEKSDEKMSAAKRYGYNRAHIEQLQENSYAAIRAPLVQVFESNAFYEVCPQCGSRLRETEEYKCKEHGAVDADYRLVITGMIDDGTGSIRAVFFGENAEAVLGMTTKEVKQLFDRKKKMSAVLEKVPLGKEFVFEGRVRRNVLFDRLEFIVNGVKEVDIKQEIGALLGE